MHFVKLASIAGYEKIRQIQAHVTLTLSRHQGTSLKG